VLQGNFEHISSSSQKFPPECRLTNDLREDSRKPKEKKHKHSAVKRQCLRAENVIVEWQRAQEILPVLQEAAEKDDIRLIETRPGSPVPHESPMLRSSSALMKNQETTLAVIEAAAAGAFGSKSEKRALILRNTDNWLNQLLSEWTVLSSEDPEIEREVNLNIPEELPHEDQSLAPNVEASEHGRKDYRPTKVKSDGNVSDFDVHIKRSEEELAEPRREKRVSSPPTRNYRDRRIYEEYGPSGSYFDEGYRHREEEPRTTLRKYDDHEREKRPDVREPEKERKSTKWPEKAANDLPFAPGLKFKAKAGKAREAVKEKTQEKETHASSAKTRDRGQRGERMDKQRSRRAYVPLPRTLKLAYNLSPRAEPEPEPTRRPTSRREEEEEEEEDKEDKEEHKWHGRKETAREYIERSQRPGLSVGPSSSRTY
jgi:hypothetical protein